MSYVDGAGSHRPKSGQGAAFLEPGVHSPTKQPVCLYRLPQVLARIPVSRSAWFAGIQAGRYPRGYHLGPRTTVWRSDDIDRIVTTVTARPACASWIDPIQNLEAA